MARRIPGVQASLVTDYASLKKTLDVWLDDSALVAETRRFLNSHPASKRSGLGDAQIANWKRPNRRMPASFVEGAALYHCATPNLAPPVRMEAETFWQVFIVHDRKDQQTGMDCTILRYWQRVQWHDDDTSRLTHTAHRSIGEGGGATPEPRSLPNDDAGFEWDPEDDGSVSVSWKIGREPRDCGYALHFPAAIMIDEDHPDAVGGCPTIPVRAAHVLTFVPRSVADRQRKSPGNPRGIPSAIATLPSGNPARLMETYLGIREKKGAKGDFSRLGPWFEEGPQVTQVKEWSHFDLLPNPILEDQCFKSAENSARQNHFRVYATQYEKPSPFLTYFMVFDRLLPDNSKDE